MKFDFEYKDTSLENEHQKYPKRYVYTTKQTVEIYYFLQNLWKIWILEIYFSQNCDFVFMKY